MYASPEPFSNLKVKDREPGPIGPREQKQADQGDVLQTQETEEIANTGNAIDGPTRDPAWERHWERFDDLPLLACHRFAC
jgi:hypothetical protein